MIRLFSTFFDSTNQGGSCIIVSLKPSLNKNPLMTTTQLALDKKAHPLMMHLTSKITSMSGSWCTRSASCSEGVWPFQTFDDARQEDD